MAHAIYGVIVRDRLVVPVIFIANQIITSGDNASFSKAAAESRVVVIYLSLVSTTADLSIPKEVLTPVSMTAILTPLPL